MSRTSTRRARLLAVAALAALPLALTAVPAQAVPTAADLPPAAQGTVPGAWIVTLEPGASSERVAKEHAQRHGARVDHVYRHAVRGYAARMSDEQAALVAQDARVAAVERDQVVVAYGKPGPAPTPATELPTGVDRIEGDKSSALSGDRLDIVNVDVAVIDSGIDLTHPDLVVAGGVNCSTGTSHADGNGHGTHVAGTIGAKDDGRGVVGVAPGARLWAVRVLDNRGSGSWSSMLCGIEWVTSNATAIEVANMSLGGSGTAGETCASSSLRQAICTSVAAGVTYVVAAGNDGADAATSVPAAYPEVITVSALADFNGQPGGRAPATCRTDVDDTFATFSNHGTDVDLIAPGVCIRSTWKGGGYNTISGTSMASPHVAGAAALVMAKEPDTQPQGVQTALISPLHSSTDWFDSDDPDGIKEPLVDVAGF